jgi:hypothetical protein
MNFITKIFGPKTTSVSQDDIEELQILLNQEAVMFESDGALSIDAYRKNYDRCLLAVNSAFDKWKKQHYAKLCRRDRRAKVSWLYCHMGRFRILKLDNFF